MGVWMSVRCPNAIGPLGINSAPLSAAVKSYALTMLDTQRMKSF